MKRLPLILLFYAILFNGHSQLSAPASGTDSVFTGFRPKAFHYNLSIGTSFITTAGYGSALTSSVTPSFSYNISKRFTIGGGLSYNNTSLFGLRSPYFGGESGAPATMNFNDITLFVNGSYLVSDRLTLSGSAFKQLPLTRDPLPYNPFVPYSSKGAQGIDFSVDYRIGRNAHIQAGFRYTEGINPWYQPAGLFNPSGRGMVQPFDAPFHYGW